MPKIIENVGERLLDELELMFRETDGDISLRRLAARAGVAVGTIYNYFPDKDDLIKSLFQREWGRAVQRMVSALEGVPKGAGRRELAGVVVEMVYGGVERHGRSGGGGDLLCRGTKPYPLRPEGWKWLGRAFAPVWQRVFGNGQLDDGFDGERLTVALITMVHRLVALFPDDRTANVEFLTDTIARTDAGQEIMKSE